MQLKRKVGAALGELLSIRKDLTRRIRLELFAYLLFHLRPMVGR